jgi:hypothetical protein
MADNAIRKSHTSLTSGPAITTVFKLFKRMFALLPQLSNAKCLIFLESRLDFR